MARQCHLDTCPTGIATQREDLRAKFAGTPDDVVRFFTAIAEDLRRELALVGARSVGEIVGESRRLLAPAAGRPSRARAGHRRGRLGGRTPLAGPTRRVPVATSGARPASPLEAAIAAAFRGQGSVTAAGLRLSTADRSFGAGLTGALERGELHGPIRLELHGAAGQSFGAFAGPGVDLRLIGQANDYVAKGLSGGRITVAPEADLGADRGHRGDRRQHVLYGATGGPAPPGRPGGDALRRPQQRGRGGRRGDRPARLRVHDRRDGRRARAGRRELRGRDDRRPGVPVRPDRPPRGRPRRPERRGGPARLRRSPIGRTARLDWTSWSACSRPSARPAPSSPTGCCGRPISAASFWLVEPIVQPVAIEAVTVATPARRGAATGPQRSRARSEADDRERGSYDGSIVGTRHPGLDVSSFPFSQVPASGGADMIHPSDSELRPDRRPRRAPGPGHVRRLRLPADGVR